MVLETVRNKLSELPTIIDIADEISCIKDLMRIGKAEAIEKPDLLLGIIGDLHLSHTDTGYMEVGRDDEYIFLEFSKWLKLIKSDWGINVPEYMADDFCITEDEVRMNLENKID